MFGGLTEDRRGEHRAKTDEPTRSGAVGEEIGSRPSRVSRQTDQLPPSRVAAPLQLEGKHQHREFRLAIRFPGEIKAVTLKIAEIDRPRTMRDAAEIDDARRGSRTKLRQQPRRQGKVAEKIGAKLHLEAIDRRLTTRQRHNARIVDQDVE